MSKFKPSIFVFTFTNGLTAKVHMPKKNHKGLWEPEIIWSPAEPEEEAFAADPVMMQDMNTMRMELGKTLSLVTGKSHLIMGLPDHQISAAKNGKIVPPEVFLADQAKESRGPNPKGAR